MSTVSAFELENKIYNLIRLGMNQNSIIKSLSPEVNDDILVEETVKNVCESYPDYDLIQSFMDSKIVVDIDGEDNKLYMYDHKTYELTPIEASKLSAILSPKLNWSYKRYTCRFTYDPYNPYKIKKFGKEWRFNLYIPPRWRRSYFYSHGSKSLPIVSEIPMIYKNFITHLVNSDVESYEYTLDWLANAIQYRNYCMLVTIGKRGIGKGVLGTIMSGLVGEKNYTKTDKRLISKDFNNQISNKRIIYLDEIEVTSTDQDNKIKDLINDDIEIEAKGIDAVMKKNYSSFYISSNNLKSIKIPVDNRRYSTIELTQKKLIDAMSLKDIKSLTNKENIDKLAYYLMNRKIDSDKMMRVLNSANTERIKIHSLGEWQSWFLYELRSEHMNETIEFKKVQHRIEDEFDFSRPPGRDRFFELADYHGDKFDIFLKRVGKKQSWFIKFKGESCDS